MTNQPILAFDCATIGGSVAVMCNGSIVSRRIGQTAQAAELLPAIDGLLREADISYHAISCIISTVGPGSFTGVRIGLAALHGLVLVHHTPIKMLTTLEAMAWAVAQTPHAPDEFFIALRAGKGELYSQRFSANCGLPNAMGDISLVPETLTQWGAPCFGNHLAPENASFIDGPDATALCAIAHHLPLTPLAEALPLYIRAPDAIIGTPHPWLMQH
mgnify:CR=1 FL=1